MLGAYFLLFKYLVSFFSLYYYNYFRPFILSQVVYTKKDLFCWVSYSADQKNQNAQLAVLLVYQGIPLIVGFLMSLIGYIKTIKRIREIQDAYLYCESFDVYKLLWYPAVMFMIFLPSLVDNIVLNYTKEGNVFIEAVHLLLTHSIGFINALVYGAQMRRVFFKHIELESSQIIRGASRRSSLSNSLIEDLREVSP